MKYKILLFLTLIFTSCQKTESLIKKNDTISEKEIYFIINMLINELGETELKEGKLNFVVDKTSIPQLILNSNVKKSFSKYFNKEDYKYFDEQLENRKDFKISQKEITKKIISKSELNQLIDPKSSNVKEEFIRNYTKKYGNSNYIEFSLPLFSKDKKKVLIDINYFPSGGCTILFQKSNEESWKSEIIMSYT
ncbi:hypothetical protein [Flavobacterium urocaniciphilum]|uniref:Lipoprotein n=1 Tax=Flavobacterium urocaniciphilum TaxID=1299341 RepID=A0A1H8YU56_9FLAO|nr:hypothetical protein [Flavobacterium urocaniciphilum]SEP55612.1 hypothetical protein SAMN05444005_101219 [Flavobacterium urocaniciphilum]